MKAHWIRAVLWGIAVAAPVVVVLAYGFGRDPHAVPFALKDRPAPNFELPQLNGTAPLSLGQLRGQPVVLNFWASWCSPCEAEHEALRWGARRYRGQVAFVGIVFDDRPEAARLFLARQGADYPHLMDSDDRTAIDYGIAGVPETFFIDAEGMLRDKLVGPIAPQILTEKVQRLLASSSTLRPQAKK